MSASEAAGSIFSLQGAASPESSIELQSAAETWMGRTAISSLSAADMDSLKHAVALLLARPEAYGLAVHMTLGIHVSAMAACCKVACHEVVDVLANWTKECWAPVFKEDAVPPGAHLPEPEVFRVPDSVNSIAYDKMWAQASILEHPQGHYAHPGDYVLPHSVSAAEAEEYIKSLPAVKTSGWAINESACPYLISGLQLYSKRYVDAPPTAQAAAASPGASTKAAGAPPGVRPRDERSRSSTGNKIGRWKKVEDDAQAQGSAPCSGTLTTPHTAPDDRVPAQFNPIVSGSRTSATGGLWLRGPRSRGHVRRAPEPRLHGPRDPRHLRPDADRHRAREADGQLRLGLDPSGLRREHHQSRGAPGLWQRADQHRLGGVQAAQAGHV